MLLFPYDGIYRVVLVASLHKCYSNSMEIFKPKLGRYKFLLLTTGDPGATNPGGFSQIGMLDYLQLGGVLFTIISIGICF